MNSIFPQDSMSTDTYLTNPVKITYGKSPIFDFEKGEFVKVDGRVCMAEGVEVLRNWIEKTLQTERFRFPIYSFDYGVTLEELVTKELPYQVLINEIREQIADALLQDSRIKGVGNFEFNKMQSSLYVEFSVSTFQEDVIDMGVSI